MAPSRVPLIVRCLGAAVRPPRVSSSREPSSLSEICSRDRVPTLAAASSMASGMPSSLLHTSATARALPGVKVKEGSRLRARARNKRADSELCSSSSVVGERSRSGTERGWYGPPYLSLHPKRLAARGQYPYPCARVEQDIHKPCSSL